MPDNEFQMTILGRTIEHLGTQMYKHRAPSIAELVANCWDAGAKNVYISIPEPDEYDQSFSKVQIVDDGEGMNSSSIQRRYLVVGRNRREEDGGAKHGRKIMGRKGIGKLAGFGLAEKVTICTWTEESQNSIQFSMDLYQLKGNAGKVHDIRFPWIAVKKPENFSKSGTTVELSGLRHTTPIDIDSLLETLARRFSRTTRGEMKIYINTKPLPEPSIDALHTIPEDGGYQEEILPNGKKVRYRYQFSKKPLRSKELQGFVIFANERTAQAPPFFFNIESTASSQHSTRYVTGEIIADYLDSGVDSDTDLISTDRQELDWEKEELQEFRKWGEGFSRKILRECADLRGKQLENWILIDSEFSTRIKLLDPRTQKEVSRFLNILGQKSDNTDDRTRNLADSLIRAYEFRTFHDVIDDIEEAGDDPEKLEGMLGRLHDWKVLESRAILEIVRGRLSIIKKMENMILNDVPETASSRTYDNLHDLLAEYPWLFNPEWQVFAEEKSVGKQLREWGEKDCPDDMKNKRVDFLAFDRESGDLIIIEMKRPGHAVEFDEMQRLEQYQETLMKARGNCSRVLVYGGAVNINTKKWESMKSADDFEAVKWSDMFNRARKFYSHYEAVLYGDVSAIDFRRKEIEISRTRNILETGSSHRSKEDRARGIGNTSN